jgi:hypothetical protein
MAVPPWYHAKTNFTGGEWSDDLAGRFDLPQFHNASRRMTNWLVQPHGGTYTAPGTVQVAPVKNSSQDQVLIPFEFNAEQTYAVEMGHQYLRFYTQHGRIEGNAQTITDVVDSGGLIRVTCAGHGYANGDPVVIRGVLGAWEANGDWAVEDVDTNEFSLTGSAFDGTYISGGTARSIYEIPGQHTESNVREVRIAQNADTMYLFHRDYHTYKLTRTGAATFSLTAEYWKIAPFGDTNETAITIIPNGTAINSNVTIVASAGLFTSNDNDRHYRIANGVVRIHTNGVINSTHANAVITKTAVNAATADWAPGEWSVTDGFPAAGIFYENRLVVGRVQTIYGTRSGEFNNFDMSVADNPSYGWKYNLASKTANMIRWFAAEDLLIVGTSGRGFKVTGSDNGGITPLSVFARPQFRQGSAQIEPVETTSGVVFAQLGRRKLRRVTFDINADKFAATDMSLLANRLAREGNGPTQLTYQSEPNETVWMCRGDGILAAVCLLSDQNVNAWSRRTTNGLFTSVCATKTENDDDVWVIAEREIGSKTTRFVEYFDPEISVDCAVKTTFNSAVTNITSGLHHLEGADVVIVGDNAVYPTQQVIHGALSEPLDPSATQVVVGLAMETPRIEFFFPHRDFNDGTTVGRNNKITGVTLRVNETRGLTVSGDTNFSRSTEDIMGEAPAEEQTDIRFTPSLNWNEPLVITQDLPFRATIHAVVQHVETGD